MTKRTQIRGLISSLFIVLSLSLSLSLSLQDGLRASRGPASRSGIGLEPNQRPGSGPGMVAGSGPGSGPRAGEDLTRDLARDRAWLLATDLNNTSRFGEYHTGKIRRKTNRKLGTWYGCWSGTWLGTSSREGPGQRPGSDLAWLLARDLNSTTRLGGYHTGEFRRKTNRKVWTWYGCWPRTWIGTSSREEPGKRPGVGGEGDETTDLGHFGHIWSFGVPSSTSVSRGRSVKSLSLPYFVWVCMYLSLAPPPIRFRSVWSELVIWRPR